MKKTVETKKKAQKKAPKKTSQQQVNNDMQELAGRVSAIASIAVKADDRKIGVRNIGCQSWLKDRHGAEYYLKTGEGCIVDQFSFRHLIMKLGIWDMGFLYRDDSLLSSSDVPSDPTEPSKNFVSDEDMAVYLKNEQAGLDRIAELTSSFSVNRILDAASKAKPKRIGLIEACTEKLFLVDNDLPSNFYQLGTIELGALIDRKHLPVVPEFGDDADSIRERILEHYGAE